jgi:hypothetical protein
METLALAGVGIAFWLYFVKNRLLSSKEDSMIEQAIGPLTGNPAIVDPLRRAHVGDDLKLFMPVPDPALKMLKPFDKAPTEILQHKSFLPAYELAWQQNYWDKPVNSFLDSDMYSGNNMVPMLAGVMKSNYQ